MNEKQSEPDLSLRAQRRKPSPAPQTPAPGAVIPAEPATASDLAGGYVPLARRGAPTVALNVRVPETCTAPTAPLVAIPAGSQMAIAPPACRSKLPAPVIVWQF